MRHRVEALGYGTREFRLPAGQHLAHGVDAARRVGLDAHDLGHPLFELSGVQVVARCLDPAGTRRARQHDGNRGKQHEHHAGEPGQRFADGDGRAADHEERLCHGAPCSAIRLAGLNEAENTAKAPRGRQPVNEPVHIRVQR